MDIDVALFGRKDGYIFYTDWENIFFSLRTDKERSELLRAIFDLLSRGKITNFKSDGLRVAYAVLVDTLSRDCRKWDDVRKKRSEAGKKGGRPKKDEKQIKQTKAKKANAFFDNQKKQTKADKAKKAVMVKDKVQDKVQVQVQERVIYNASQSEAPAHADNSQRPYGEYMHVLLTDVQFGRLIEDFGDKKAAEYVRRVDEYVQQTGKQYKDYYLTIRKWIREDEKKERAAAAPVRGENASLDIAKIEQALNDKYRKKEKAPADVISEDESKKA